MYTMSSRWSSKRKYGFIGMPTNASCIAIYGVQGCVPDVQSWTDPFFIVLYSIWGFTFAVFLGFTCFRSVYFSRINNQIYGTNPLKRESTEDPTADEESQHLLYEKEEELPGFEKNMTAQYFRNSCTETATYLLLLLNSLILLIYYLILTIDFYYECQWVFASVDNSCFFGSFRIFGNYEMNAEAFFLVWIVMVAFSLLVTCVWRSLFDWIRIPAKPENATKVSIWVPEEVQILTSGRLSWPTRVKRNIEAKIRERYARLIRFFRGPEAAHQVSRPGTSQTVPIQQTSLGKKFFTFQIVRYLVPGETRVNLTLENPTIGSIHGLRASNGPDVIARRELVDRCGPNSIPLNLPTFYQMLAEEFLTPFYAYQVTIYLIWIWWTYWFVGVWLLLLVVLSGVRAASLKLRTLRDVYALAAHRDGVRMKMNQEEIWTYTNSHQLTLGDVVQVAIEKNQNDWIVPADLVLTNGSCAVDESGLTGESMPRAVSAISRSQRDSALIVSTEDKKFKPNILYAGTKVLEASPDAVGVVIAIGSDATRGKLLSHVLFPVITRFRFEEEFAIAVGFLLLYALVAFSIAIGFQMSNGSLSTWPTILAYGVFTVSQIVSPILKLALVAGRVAATQRLKSKNIVCLDPTRIDIAGKVKLFCFDKTGTLTKDGLNFSGLFKSDNEKLSAFSTNLSIEPEISQAAACCHSLGYFNGEYLGSAVEVALFKATGWSLTSDPAERCSSDSSKRLHVKSRFDFDQERRTMSVVVEDSPNTFKVFVKGAPESIASRCSSGVSPDLLKKANDLATEGCYVLAIAQKTITSYATSRDECEKDLECLGLLVFRNEVKDDAKEAILELKLGNIRCVMVTGDNAPCGCYVAKETSMIEQSKRIILGFLANNNEVQWKTMFEGGSGQTWLSTEDLLSSTELLNAELAITGEAFEKLRSSGDKLQDKRLLFRIRVFARMNPTQKVQVLHHFMDGEDGLVCAMVGDGGNDSGALRAAHVGLSMSTAEASVVAPFNAKNDGVMSCVELIKEGRASLATSLASYKFLVIYGLLFSIVKMVSFYYAVLMPLMGYVMIDIIGIVPLTFAMTLGKPLKFLGPKRPTSSLLGAQTVSSIVGFMLISICFIAINLGIMSADPGYVKWPAANADTAAWWYISDNWEATVIWESCFLLFIGSALSFSFGSGFRSSVLSNVFFLVVWVILFSLASLLLLLPLNWVSAQFHMASEQFNRENPPNPVWQQYQKNGGSISPAMSFDLRLSIWLSTCGGILVLLAYEYFVVYGIVGVKICEYFRKKFIKSSMKETTSLEV